MYGKLKPNDKNKQRSINNVILSKDKWTLLSERQYKRLNPFKDYVEFTEDITTIKGDFKTSLDNDREELSSLKKAELIKKIVDTNIVTDKTEEELSKLKKNELIDILEGSK